ncbi:MAG: flagellar type III secretion system protein FlhA [Candidatus Hydrogenedentota bacterium]|nr:MAG: flagellar type III secretion system protein FlhA [Candidatus Hydrogenedentota bacterium]
MNRYKQTDVFLGVSVVLIVGMMIIPIPTFLLDTLMAVSIMLGLVTIITVMYSKGNIEVSVFPSLLLVSTVFRLALNVSSTRLILLEGPAFDGKLIKAFGQFVVGGNYIVGFIIFLVLIFVQMLVIAKGANRIGEVAARFALDAMPGKQMSIDNDLNAGIITEEEARARREELKRETEFYGQMDGATKFVQGDVKVGLIITAINIVGGLLVGVWQQGLDFSSATKLYTLLTIGDGLVAQVPSLLITTATALVVTRAGAKEDLGKELSSQFFMDPKVLWITSGTLAFASLLPGFPTLSLLLISAFLGFLAYTISKAGEKVEETTEAKKEQERTPQDRVLDRLDMYTIQLELGFNLLVLGDPAQGGTLVERIGNLRERLAANYGMVIPAVRLKDNMELEGDEYVILVRGTVVAKNKLPPDKLIALETPQVKEKLEGDPYREPAFGRPAVLLDPERKKEFESAGYMVLSPSDIIVTHLDEIIRTYISDIMGREEVKLLIDKVGESQPTLVQEVQNALKPHIIVSVLHALLREGISIRNMVAILETLLEFSDKTQDPVQLTEAVRRRLGRQICQSYAPDGKLEVAVLDPEIENELRSAVTYDEREGLLLLLDPHRQMAIRDAFIQAYNQIQSQGKVPIFAVPGEVRPVIYQMLERELPPRHFAVIANEEIPPDMQLVLLTQVSMQQQEEAQT